jgi:hypothetical protein
MAHLGRLSSPTQAIYTASETFTSGSEEKSGTMVGLLFGY